MTIKKEITKFAKAIRKEAKVNFIDAIKISKWFYNKADYDRVKSIPGFVAIFDYDYTHDIDMSSYTINGISISSIYRCMKCGK